MRTKSKVYADDESREADCKAVLEGRLWSKAREGHEFWRESGEVRHVYAFLMKDGSRLRLVGPRQSPAMFSGLKAMERTVRA